MLNNKSLFLVSVGFLVTCTSINSQTISDIANKQRLKNLQESAPLIEKSVDQKIIQIPRQPLAKADNFRVVATYSIADKRVALINSQGNLISMGVGSVILDKYEISSIDDKLIKVKFDCSKSKCKQKIIEIGAGA